MYLLNDDNRKSKKIIRCKIGSFSVTISDLPLNDFINATGLVLVWSLAP